MSKVVDHRLSSSVARRLLSVRQLLLSFIPPASSPCHSLLTYLWRLLVKSSYPYRPPPSPTSFSRYEKSKRKTR